MAMYPCKEEVAQEQGALAGQELGNAVSYIDMRISEMQKQIEQLEKMKFDLSQPGGILKVCPSDLRFLINY